MARTVTEKCIVDAAASTARTLGYEKMKDHQLQVDSSDGYIEKGHDVFAVLPTGYGKILCFASLPMLFDQVYTAIEGTVYLLRNCALRMYVSVAHERSACGYWNVM